MENNEVMNVEENEVFDAEIEYADSDNNFGLGAVVGAGATLVGGLIYKFVIQPLWIKHKDKKRQKKYIEENGPVLVEVNETTEE